MFPYATKWFHRFNKTREKCHYLANEQKAMKDTPMTMRNLQGEP